MLLKKIEEKEGEQGDKNYVWVLKSVKIPLLFFFFFFTCIFVFKISKVVRALRGSGLRAEKKVFKIEKIEKNCKFR